ncbi:NUDIX hydrolase [Streptomyces sp. NBC_01618]|uniref:NUDIX hydrolase n=1 Tax=Streptomyces sp. NBC_01618 TaxID=2975900 RepID=UPI003868A9B4|nr:NUDIX domain-containing protein [Streptomyces sp. NBC_01618]
MRNRVRYFVNVAPGPEFYTRETFAYQHAVPALGAGNAATLVDSSVQVLLRPDGRAPCVRMGAGAVHGAGELALVGGHLEEGESLDQAARRKAREETGVDIDARHQEFCGLAH